MCRTASRLLVPRYLVLYDHDFELLWSAAVVPGTGTSRLLAWLTEYSAQFGAARKAEHSASFEARLRRYQRGFFTSK